MGLIEKIEDYKHQVPICYKCGVVIEPRKIPQWYVKMKPLAKMALKAVKDDKLIFYPDNYRKIFNYWMANTTDWNISRQIVWGIPIPAKICDECGHAFPDLENNIDICEKCNGKVHQDTDTFDTWFSSGQWPLIVTGYPDGKDFKEYYPTNIMETGYDLIFKWLPRMVIFSLYLEDKVPFKDVYLHGLVNDAQKVRKMSKSKGNVINPLDMTDKYGTDALRMSLVVANPPGSDTSLSENKIKGYKNFANKIWNISRFVLLSNEGVDFNEKETISDADKKIISEFDEITKDITFDMDNYRFHLAAEKLYHYIWHRLADEILEESKPILNDDKTKPKLSRQQTILYLLRNSIILLHPFMPFITEEIWKHVKVKNEGMLIIQEWPV